MRYSVALTILAAVAKASPLAMPQAVTAIITPVNGPAPAGCTPAFSGSFGIAVKNVSTAVATPARKRQAATQLQDGQPGLATMAPVSMIIDGQIQGGMHTMVVAPIGQIGDGQIQQTYAPVTEFTDGQPQAPTFSVAPVSQSTDGQPEAPTATVTPSSTAGVVTQSTDGQPEGPMTTVIPVTPTSTAGAVSQSTDGQPQASTTAAAPTATASSVTVACQSPGTLSLTLADGILKDSHGRTGYIASNFQFQFDDPPQAGAIITAGFSTCANGSLALGGSNVFYQCLSGNFYNLYNTNWAAQCSPVTIETLTLINCA